MISHNIGESRTELSDRQLKGIISANKSRLFRSLLAITLRNPPGQSRPCISYTDVWLYVNYPSPGRLLKLIDNRQIRESSNHHKLYCAINLINLLINPRNKLARNFITKLITFHGQSNLINSRSGARVSLLSSLNSRRIDL